MAATFAPAPQVTFRPQPPVALAESQTRAGKAMEGPASVRHLPVRPGADVYRRRRLIVLAVVVGLLLGVGSFVRGADATPTREPATAASLSVLVQPGDTLWGIAVELNPDGDPRQLVDQLTELVGSTSLQVGQKIVIPASILP